MYEMKCLLQRAGPGDGERGDLGEKAQILSHVFHESCVCTHSTGRGRLATGRPSGAWESGTAPPDVASPVTAEFATSNHTTGGENEVIVSASDFPNKKPSQVVSSPLSLLLSQQNSDMKQNQIVPCLRTRVYRLSTGRPVSPLLHPSWMETDLRKSCK